MRYASTPTLLKFTYLSDVEVVHCFLSFGMEYFQHIMEAPNLPVRNICVWRASLWPDLSLTALSFVSNSKPQLHLISPNPPLTTALRLFVCRREVSYNQYTRWHSENQKQEKCKKWEKSNIFVFPQMTCCIIHTCLLRQMGGSKGYLLQLKRLFAGMPQVDVFGCLFLLLGCCCFMLLFCCGLFVETFTCSKSSESLLGCLEFAPRGGGRSVEGGQPIPWSCKSSKLVPCS